MKDQTYMIFFIIFVIIPLIEISLFVSVGEEIGLVKTLLLCLLTAMIGAVLIRQQGLQTLLTARSAMNKGEVPVSAIFDGICLAVSGALLMTPGFFTDAIGFSLCVPKIREVLRHKLAAHFDIHVPGDPAGQHRRVDPDVIEVEYEKLDDRE